MAATVILSGVQDGTYPPTMGWNIRRRSFSRHREVDLCRDADPDQERLSVPLTSPIRAVLTVLA